jgi:hypothetical protein
MNTPQLFVLKAELDSDPLGRGYAAMGHDQAATDGNTPYRNLPRATMNGSEILNSINSAEWAALTGPEQQTVWNLLHLGDLNPYGVEADMMITVFGGGSVTISTLASIRTTTVSRAQELGLPQWRAIDVAEARDL